MKYHYFILSPFQYLNALEFRFTQHDDHSDHHILYILTDHPKRKKSIEKIVNQNHWSEIHYLFDAVKLKSYYYFFITLFKRKRNLTRVKKTIAKHDLAILGNINDTYCRHIFKHIDNCTVLDDGLASIFLPASMGQTEKFKLKKKRILFNLVFNQFSFKYDSLKLFTIFDIRSDAISITKNTYEEVRKIYSNGDKTLTNQVVFMGQPLVELKFMTLKNYESVISSIKNYYVTKGYEFCYIAHPKESTKFNNLEMVDLNEPVEVYFLRNKEIPLIFTSLFSTSNFSLSQLFPQVRNELWSCDQSILNYNEKTNLIFEYAGKTKNININHVSSDL